ncbi:DUF4810 domain-containing protein [Laribacter hongkongensis]|uniref:DUF4810 domain-containing protein n=1 Tax=Laribacter hongkongensis TaxID=168471 RepID=A0A248LFR2_9NEIS|nr:DUF4810 domain-containing protein [Laribacter hongkongensis]ASJ23597.1 lipoprotein [Laribacter hongkongensis]MCG9024506.1 DUF4810 domain-containing protein [Laribacter hongkongensis]MCG9030877.1 DUF4810 domain-containing protein [Laribacter hongkongensis]MCG9039532.1 DUF4810 domain-containing protein [Laribacter hongkongensis]MCG9053214.1 DUF4810 domain-containing protein [Laribacter hongkongensis]
MKKIDKQGLLMVIGLVLLVSGCASNNHQSLYQWGGYQTQVYDYFKGGDKEKQVISLEKDLEKMRASNNPVPPGVHAHLGLLYADLGNDSKAAEHLDAEKVQYQESTTYIDMLLKKFDSNKVVAAQ